jgi:predicted amidophosphoribosyltransferase
VKNRRINGTLTFPWRTGPEIINTQNVDRARWIFGVFIKSVLEQLNLPSPVLVPVPSKDGLMCSPTFRSLEMTKEATAAHGNWTIAPVLRFSEVLTPANAGGPRGREAIRPYLRVIVPPPPGQLVLIDDIVTSGGSLLASFDKLAEIDRTPVAAVVCGRTVADSLLSAFGLHQMSIDTSQQTVEF